MSLASVSIGYEVGVTALQIASAYSAIANGGVLLKPQIIQGKLSIIKGSCSTNQSQNLYEKLLKQRPCLL